jgi:thiamine-monophosphate kinase
MGGRPERAVVALSLSPASLVSVVEAFLDGLEAGAGRWNVDIVGGDISGADEMSVSVTLLGAIDAEPVLRSGARPGDAICVTGSLGGAAGGLFALQRGLAGHNADIERLAARQLRPEPRILEAETLRAATAMVDVSDGLALDLTRLMKASGTGCTVSRELVPVDPALTALEDGPDPVELALRGGEDFELLCTLDPADVDGSVQALESPLAGLTRIGVVTDDACLLDGEPLEGEELGWDHLRSR